MCFWPSNKQIVISMWWNHYSSNDIVLLVQLVVKSPQIHCKHLLDNMSYKRAFHLTADKFKGQLSNVLINSTMKMININQLRLFLPV